MRLTHSQKISQAGDIVLIGTIVAVLGLMLFPVTPALMDVMLILNLAGTLTILIVALSVADPMLLFVFPSLLLVATLFRLGLNISTTRLILSTGEAGQIIDQFAHIVTGGNLLVGIVIFIVLQIIQFLVVAKGSERVAEVAARFTLDALPGKQMSIDADLRAGLINNTEAREKRALLIKESRFYGSMDGAMKFVKGESIAGFAITVINIVGGFMIGVLQRGMEMANAAKTYTTLTIGEGLCAQIPAFLLSMSAGFLVTRVNDPAIPQSLGHDIGIQLFQNPKSLFTVAIIIFLFVLVPGVPTGTFFTIGCFLILIAWLIAQQKQKNDNASYQVEKHKVSVSGSELHLGEVLPLVLELSSELFVQFSEDIRWQECFNDLYPQLRQQLSYKLGVSMPELKIAVNSQFSANQYTIKIYELPVDTGFLAVKNGMIRDAVQANEKTTTTVHGTAVVLLDLAQKTDAKGRRIFTPEEILLRHLAQTLKRHAREFVGIQEVRNTLSHVETKNQELVREVIPRMLSIHKFTDILKRLVDEGIPINDFRLILETLASSQPDSKDPVSLTELVRLGMKRVITHKYTQGKNKISVFSLDPDLESEIATNIQKSDSDCYLTLEPHRLEIINTQIRRTYQRHRLVERDVIILTNLEIRRYVRKMIETDMPQATVLSYQELDANVIIDQRDVISIYENQTTTRDLP